MNCTPYSLEHSSSNYQLVYRFTTDALSAIEHVESLLVEADSLARTVVESCEVVRCVPLPPPMDVRFVPLPPPVVEQPPTPIWETEEDLIADLMLSLIHI